MYNNLLLFILLLYPKNLNYDVNSKCGLFWTTTLNQGTILLFHVPEILSTVFL